VQLVNKVQHAGLTQPRITGQRIAGQRIAGQRIALTGFFAVHGFMYAN